ncbi:MAG TPA: hypothetical protein VIV65_01480 [Gemmatimonadaceae bacterium]
MRLKPYPVYKDSGVEWLGEIPAHWQVERADAFLRYDKVQVEPSTIIDEAVFLYSIPSVQTTGDGSLEAPSEIDSAKLRIVGERLLVSKLNPRKGVVLIAREKNVPTLCSTEFVPFEVEGCDLRWALYLFLAESTRQRLSAIVRSATRSHQRAEISEIVKLWHAVPPLEEQRVIAGLLDRATARIDALVAKKERLIDLLKERRTGLITFAVTKGLERNVPMKDSGVEWLGEIPAHWRALALKRIGGLQAGAGFPDVEQGFQDEEVPFFKVGDMGAPGNEREMLVHQHSVSRATARRLGAFVFPTGTIVFAKVGAALLLNRRRLVARPSCIDNNMMGFMPEECYPAWAMYWLSELDMGELANPGAVPSVNEGQMRGTPAAVPPPSEQSAIAAFLDRETARIDDLITKVDDAIDRLKELRTALISAAVTGKIDLREEVA